MATNKHFYTLWGRRRQLAAADAQARAAHRAHYGLRHPFLLLYYRLYCPVCGQCRLARPLYKSIWACDACWTRSFEDLAGSPFPPAPRGET